MRDFIRCFLIRPFISFLLFAGLFLSSPAVAANEDQPQVWKTLEKLIQQGNCAQSWQEVWKEARKGNTEALTGLWGSIVSGSLIPPSYFPVTEDIRPRYTIDNLIALAMYARKDKVMLGDYLLHGIVSDEIMGDYIEPDVREKIQSVNRCFKRKRSLDVCYAMAVKLRFIPSFEQYVTFIDNAPRPAFCLPGGRPGPASTEDLGLSNGIPGATSVPLKQ